MLGYQWAVGFCFDWIFSDVAERDIAQHTWTGPPYHIVSDPKLTEQTGKDLTEKKTASIYLI